MPETHYGPETKDRTAPILARLLSFMQPRPGEHEGRWIDPDAIAAALGERVATVQSKGREVNDKHHRHLGLRWERRKKAGAPRGAYEYRFSKVEPEQLPLLEGARADQA